MIFVGGGAIDAAAEVRALAEHLTAPVVAYRRGSVPEIIDPGITGTIIDNETDAVEAVHQIDRLNRRACRRRFEKRFSSKRMAEDYLAVYDKVISEKHHPSLTLT